MIDEEDQWDKFLEPVLFGYRTSVHSSTGFSPYELMFKRKPRLSCEVKTITFLSNPSPNACTVKQTQKVRPACKELS